MHSTVADVKFACVYLLSQQAMPCIPSTVGLVSLVESAETLLKHGSGHIRGTEELENATSVEYGVIRR
jgi:hypothetical protein